MLAYSINFNQLNKRQIIPLSTQIIKLTQSRIILVFLERQDNIKQNLDGSNFPFSQILICILFSFLRKKKPQRTMIITELQKNVLENVKSVKKYTKGFKMYKKKKKNPKANNMN